MSKFIKYNQSKKGRARSEKYRKTKLGKATRRKYAYSKKGKKARKKALDKYREKMREVK